MRQQHTRQRRGGVSARSPGFLSTLVRPVQLAVHGAAHSGTATAGSCPAYG